MQNEELLDDNLEFPVEEDDSHEYASVVYRLLAFLIDMGIMLLPVIVFGPFTVYSEWRLLFIWLAVMYVYFMLPEQLGLRGSPGKYVLRMRVCDRLSQKITLFQSFKRTSYKVALFCFYFFYEFAANIFFPIAIKYQLYNPAWIWIIKIAIAVSGVIYFFYSVHSIYKNDRGQSWYDERCGTFVIRKIKEEQP